MLLFLLLFNFFFLCVVLFYFYFFFTIGVHWIFFVLMHCEARERFSRPMRSGMCAVDGIVDWMAFCMAGNFKKNYKKIKPHIYEIYVECIWRTSPELHVISEYWRRRKRLGRWRGSINWGQELRSIRFHLTVVLGKCFVIRGVGCWGSVRCPVED